MLRNIVTVLLSTIKSDDVKNSLERPGVIRCNYRSIAPPGL